MTCEAANDLIGLYTDDALPETPRRTLEGHLLVCRDCAWEALTLRITRDRLRGDMPDVVASDAFRARTLSRIFADNPHVTPAANGDREADRYQLPIPLE